MAELLNLGFIAFLVITLKCSITSACLNESPCLCEIDEYHRIDLTPLSKTLNEKTFLEDEDANGNSFYFHGCQDGNFMHNISKNGNKTEYHEQGSFFRVNITNYVNATNFTNAVSVGKSSQIKFTKEKDIYQIVYKDGDNLIARFDLICINYGESFIKVLTNVGTNPVLTFNSPLACIVQHHPGLSTGSVLLLIFFIALAIYFIGGSLVLYFMRGARGVEVIPNVDFWRSVPGLMRDGLIFLFSGCNASAITTPETYDRI